MAVKFSDHNMSLNESGSFGVISSFQSGSVCELYFDLVMVRKAHNSKQ